MAPHAVGVRRRWVKAGVEALTFRYAPKSFEVLGFGRSLNSDEAIRWRAGAVAPLYALSARRALRRLARERDFDLVHAHWIIPNGLVAAIAGGDLPIAVGLHGSDVFLAERRGVRRLVAGALRRTRLLTGCSPELVDRVCALGFDASRAHVIPYGVDAAQFSPDASRRGEWRRRLRIPEDASVILAVGRMVTKKGFQILLDAAPQVLERFPDAHLVLAGAGDRLEEFRQRASSFPARVHFPGVVLRDTLPDLYRAADLFALPAVHDTRGNVDGLPNVILEAMASGLPVVASRISGIPLAIEDGREGVLVPEQDSPALCAALLRLLSDRSRRLEMGRAARRKAETELAWSAIAARYRDAYQQMLAEGQPTDRRSDAIPT